VPELTAAVEKVGLKWGDFIITDNSCKPHPPPKSLVEVRVFLGGGGMGRSMRCSTALRLVVNACSQQRNALAQPRASLPTHTHTPAHVLRRRLRRRRVCWSAASSAAP
jgi:hypothetical protein